MESGPRTAERLTTPDVDDHWDVVVVGAGPAGCVAARQLALKGNKVLLIEKSRVPRRKVCGGCLNSAALSVLDRCGLRRLPSLAQAPRLTRLQLRNGSRTATISLPGGVSIARDQFDSELVAAATTAGVTFVHETMACGAELQGDLRRVTCSQQDRKWHVHARLVILASGLGSQAIQRHKALEPVAARGARIGLGTVLAGGPAAYEPGVIYMNYDRAGYVGLVRLADGSLDVAAAVSASALKRAGSATRLVQGILQRAGAPVLDNCEDADWKGTPPLTQKPARLGDQRLLSVGDAAGYVEPFTGEGMAWALMSGYLVAEVGSAAVDQWSDQWVVRWEQLHARHIGRRQRVCHRLTRALQSPLLTACMTRVLSRLPQLARPVVRSLYAPFDFN